MFREDEMEGKTTLNRQLGMREGITITTGTVVGVGLFTTGAQCVGIMGAGVILLTFIGLLICILPALMYAEMGGCSSECRRHLQLCEESHKRSCSKHIGMALSDSSYCDVLYRVAGVFKLFFMDIQSSGNTDTH